MSEEAGLLQAIIEQPDDDAPRLVYADWLEERGDADRAGFIRAQCQVARFCRPEPLAGVRADQLQPAHRQAFLAPLLALGLWEYDSEKPGMPGGYRFTFARGFVTAIDVNGRSAVTQFIKLADRVFAVTPLLMLRIPRYWEPGTYYEPFAYIGPGTGTDPLTPARLRALMKLPVISCLRWLDLRDHGLGDDAARVLLKCPHLTDRTTIYLDGNQISEDGAAALRARFGAAAVLTADDGPF